MLNLTTHDAIAISVDTISVQILLQARTTERENSELEKIGGEIERYVENLASRSLDEITDEMAKIKLKYVNKVCGFVVGYSLEGVCHKDFRMMPKYIIQPGTSHKQNSNSKSIF